MACTKNDTPHFLVRKTQVARKYDFEIINSFAVTSTNAQSRTKVYGTVNNTFPSPPTYQQLPTSHDTADAPPDYTKEVQLLLN